MIGACRLPDCGELRDGKNRLCQTHQRERQRYGWHPIPPSPHGAKGQYAKGCRCEECVQWNREKVKNQRVSNPERVREIDRRRHLRDREKRIAANRDRYWLNREVVRAAQKRSYELDPDRFRASSRRYRQEHPDAVRVADARWRAENRGVVAASKRARKALKRSAGVFVIAARDERRLLARYRGCCAYCPSPVVAGENLHWDHVVPIRRGGRHSIGNLLPACDRCNLSKGAKLLMDWLRWRSTIEVAS